MVAHRRPTVSTWPALSAIVAARATVPVIAPSPPRSRPSRSGRLDGSDTSEGFHQGAALGFGQVGGDEGGLSPVNALPESVRLALSVTMNSADVPGTT